MKNRRVPALVAAVAAGALVLSACSDDGSSEGGTSGGGNAGLSEGTSVNIAWNQPFYSYNANSSVGNATANAIIKYMIGSGFNYYNADLELVPDTSYGTYEVTSEDPLTIDYTFADTATWEDGQPVTPTDMLLEWAAQSGTFNTVEPETDDEGNITNQDALDAGVAFDGVSACIPENITQRPEISDSTITLVYDRPFADWETCLTGANLPAHVVGQRALDIEDPAEATQAVQDAIVNSDTEALSAISRVWSNDFNYTSMPDDPGLALSNGAYSMTDFVTDQYMTLTANENYQGDLSAQIETVTIRWISDALATVQALQNGEVDLISPQSTADVLQALEGDESLTVDTGQGATYEHVDLSFTNGGPFDPATYGGDEDTALAVRQAFLKTIPREQIVENLIQPLAPDATVRDSFTQVAGSPMYEGIVGANGQSEQYGEVDIDAATQLLADAGVETPVQVRLLFDPANTRRQNEFELISQSAEQAGFDVVPYDVQTDWGTDLDDARNFWDAALFGWQSTSTAVTGSNANYVTDGGNNKVGYSNEAVDAALNELGVTTDVDRQEELLAEVETQLIDDAFGVTIFQFPEVTAYNGANIGNIQTITLSPTIFYGFWEWTPGDQAN